MDSVGFLTIVSAPGRASVTINDSLIGFTPLENFKLPVGHHSLRIQKPLHHAYLDSISILPRDTLTLTVNLKPFRTLLTIERYPDEVTVWCDGELLGVNDTTILPSGSHDIEARLNPSRPMRSLVYEFQVGRLHILKATFGAASPTHIIQSAVLPGLGQFADRYKYEGTLFSLGFLGGGIAAYFLNDIYNDDLGHFQSARLQYLSATSEPAIAEARALMQSRHKKLTRHFKQRNVALAVLGVAYVLSLVEAVLFHSNVDTLDVSIPKEDLVKTSVLMNLYDPLFLIRVQM